VACGGEEAIESPQFAVIAAADGGEPALDAGSGSPCPDAEPCRILPLGDSITYGVGSEGGYRVELFRKALAAGRSITFLGSQRNGPEAVGDVSFPQQHEGHGGLRIDQLMSFIPKPALRESPHIVLLMIGANDIVQDHDVANAPQRLGELVDRLTDAEPAALIVVAKLTPFRTGDSQVATYNEALDPVIEARAAEGKHVQLVDMFTGFPDSELGDDVHPNASGYERIAETWYTAISELLR
jgi:hypothetical protein